jgi:hypothetical protein
LESLLRCLRLVPLLSTESKAGDHAELGKTIAFAFQVDSRTTADISVGALIANPYRYADMRAESAKRLQGNAEQRKRSPAHNNFIAAGLLY